MEGGGEEGAMLIQLFLLSSPSQPSPGSPPANTCSEPTYLKTKEPKYLEADTEDPFSNMKTKDITYFNTKEQKYQARETKESMYILGAE